MSLPDKITLRAIDKKIAKQMIETHHYTHKFTSCRHALGIFYAEESKSDFFSSGENLVGCLIYGAPVGRLAIKSVSNDLENNQVLELTRLFVYDEYPKNIESCCIGKSFAWLKENDPEVEVLISYADPSQNHPGYIYQATNWIYQGNDRSVMERYAVSLTDDPYDWMHHRTVFETYGTVGMQELKRQIGKTFWIRIEPDKHRYVYLLRRRKYWIKRLNHPSLPYPKQQTFTEDIREVIHEG